MNFRGYQNLSPPKALAGSVASLPAIIAGAIGSAVVIGGVGLLARRRARPKTLRLEEADLAVDEWHAVVEFETADEGEAAGT